MSKLIKLIFIFNIFLISEIDAQEQDFSIWLNTFKTKAIKSGISKKVVEDVMSDAKFLPKVIEYDRYQPEFYENTFTYIKKRTSKKKVYDGLKLYKKEKNIIDKIENEYGVEKELLLALMGIETNFGKYLGKMDIVSSLATLSFDKRRSQFFTEELLKWKSDINKANSLGNILNSSDDNVSSADVVDQASSYTDKSVEMKALNRSRKLISKINAALQRLKDGTYGYCEETGEPIGIKRLMARPVATLSIEAQERHERDEKIFIDD